MELGLIFARAANGVIGKGNQLPWHLPEDLAHFKALTLGCPVIMGRKTWDSLPAKFRPLPGRRNVVVTRQSSWSEAGAERAGSLVEALTLVQDAPRVWVTGGSELYRLALPLAQVVEATEIGAEYDGDAYAPDLGPEWNEVARVRNQSAAGLPYDFVTYRRGTA